MRNLRKSRKSPENKKVAFHMIRSGETFSLNGMEYVKVRSKTGMTVDGKVVSLPDAAVVEVKRRLDWIKREAVKR